MRKNSEKSARKKRRLMPSAYERVRALETLKQTPANAAEVELLADVLALWARFMLEVNPSTAAPRVYRALMDAWKDNRGELYDADAAGDVRDHRTINFHGAFLARMGELCGEPPPPPAMWEGNLARMAELACEIISQLNGMRERVHKAAAPQGKAGDVPLGPRFAGDPVNRDQRLKELRERLERLDDDITSCTPRFQLEKEIYDLEHPRDGGEEWPEYIGREED